MFVAALALLVFGADDSWATTSSKSKSSVSSSKKAKSSLQASKKSKPGLATVKKNKSSLAAKKAKSKAVASRKAKPFIVADLNRQNDCAASSNIRYDLNANDQAKSIIFTANQYLGVPYRSGGKCPSQGFDCSGFVSYVLKQHGLDLGGSSPELVTKGQKISRGELSPGDLVFFTSKRKSKRVAHVGIYLGNGEFIHAASRNHRIQINELSENYWSHHYYGARRI